MRQSSTIDNFMHKRKKSRTDRQPDCLYSKRLKCKYKACPFRDQVFFYMLRLWAEEAATPSLNLTPVMGTTERGGTQQPNNSLCKKCLIALCVPDINLRGLKSYVLTGEGEVTARLCELTRQIHKEWTDRLDGKTVGSE